MTAASTALFVVRVTTRGQAWTSNGMAEAAADDLADAFEDQVIALGGSYGFVNFTGRGGRELSIRARDITSIEVRPEREFERVDDSPHPQPPRRNGIAAVHSMAGAGQR